MKSFTVFYIAALFVLVVCAIVIERRERKKPPTVEFGPRVINDVVIERPPCKLQMDKTKPNYNDCGAFKEPIAPMGDWNGPTTAEGKWIMENGRLKVIPPPKDKK